MRIDFSPLQGCEVWLDDRQRDSQRVRVLLTWPDAHRLPDELGASSIRQKRLSSARRV